MKLKRIFILLFIFILLITGMQRISYAALNVNDPNYISDAANDWISTGENNPPINATNIAKTTKGFQELAGLLWGIGVFVAVAVGIFLGIRFMVATPNGKAEISTLLTPYIIGVVVVVGALTIWRVAVNILDI